jgi:hexosaminidase
MFLHSGKGSARIRGTALNLILGALLSATAPLASAQSPLHLIPVPREVHAIAASPLPSGVQILCSGCAAGAEDRFAADDLAATFQSHNIPTTAARGFRIELARLANHPVSAFTDEMKPEGYVITSTPASLIVVGATAEGLFY